MSDSLATFTEYLYPPGIWDVAIRDSAAVNPFASAEHLSLLDATECLKSTTAIERISAATT
jgi:hypothetical protein